MKILIDSKEDIIEKETDSRGRITLGMEYSNSKITLAILNLEDHSEEGEKIDGR